MSVDKNRWKLSSHIKYNIGYHLIWCPKYRKKVLADAVEKDLKELINVVSLDLNFEVVSMEVMPDHVHLFIKCPPTLSPHYVVQQLKGTSSRVLRDKHPHLKSRIPSLWTRSYFCESVGAINEESIKAYIENQKNV